MMKPQRNIDDKVVNDFGLEWSKFDQTGALPDELFKIFLRYFSQFPWDHLPENAKGFDLGCGSGRWATFVAPRVLELNCIDPSEKALTVAKNNLKEYPNCKFHLAGVDAIPFADNSMDFGYSLGVLHHVPDTAAGIKKCVEKLKPGAPFLIYLYYAFDFRPIWFKAIWRASDLVRRLLSRSPYFVKYVASQLIALVIYLPFAKLANFFEKCGGGIGAIPLSEYRNKSFYIMRTDALDRFGTRLERRFTKNQIYKMMLDAGLTKVTFSDNSPFWCALGYKK